MLKRLKKMKKTYILYFVLISIVINTSVYAATNSAVFLRINSSARTAALGGLGTAIYGDVSNTEQNPASLYWIDQREIVVSHNEWFEGIRSEYMAYAYPFRDDLIFAVSGKYLYIDGMNKTDSSGNLLGKFSSNDSVYTITLTKRLNDNIGIGASTKFIKQVIDSSGGSVVAGDVGVIYNVEDRMSFGAAIRNVGDSLAIHKEAFPLPLTYSVGSAYYFDSNLNLGLDIDKEINCDTIYKFGADYFLLENINLRLGYSHTSATYANPGITFGLGFNMSYKVYIDYAFVPYGDLGDTHRFSLKYVF